MVEYHTKVKMTTQALWGTGKGGKPNCSFRSAWGFPLPPLLPQVPRVLGVVAERPCVGKGIRDAEVVVAAEVGRLWVCTDRRFANH